MPERRLCASKNLSSAITGWGGAGAFSSSATSTLNKGDDDDGRRRRGPRGQTRG